MFDLTEVVETKSARLQLVNAKTGALTQAFIELAGPMHPKRRKIDLARRRELQNRFQKRPGKFQLPDPEEIDSDQIELAVACTLAWEGIGAEKNLLPCTPENVREAYTNRRDVLAQVLSFMDEEANFLQSTGGD